ncbi:MAG: hypothetical protein ACRCSL_10200, partial [Microbacterium sp.]
KLRGPLAVEGGVTGADRSLELGLKLPGEKDGPLFAIATQAPESKQIDVLTIYNDSSVAHGRGVMTKTSLTGFGMAKDLDFGAGYAGEQGETFGESRIFRGGISFGTVAFVDGAYQTDGAKSTVEVVNLLLGSGNDRLDIQGTLQPDVPVKVIGTVTLSPQGAGAGVPAGTTHALTRGSPFDWKAQGFLVGQPVTITGMNGQFRVVGFGDSDPGDTTDNTILYLQLLSGSAVTGTASRTVVAADVPVTRTGAIVVAPIGADGGTITRTDGGNWTDDGFVVGQLVRIQNVAGQWRIVGVTDTVLTLARGDVMTVSMGGANRTVFVPGPHGGLTVVHGGGNSPISNTFAMTRTPQGGGGIAVTRGDGLPWGVTPTLPGSGYVAGNPYGTTPQHVQLAGETFTRLVLGFGDVDCLAIGITDPFPGCGVGAVMYLSGPLRAGGTVLGGGTSEITVSVADPKRIETAGQFTVKSDRILRAGGSFVADGFRVGMQVRISGLPGVYTVAAVSAGELRLNGTALQP